MFGRLCTFAWLHQAGQKVTELSCFKANLKQKRLPYFGSRFCFIPFSERAYLSISSKVTVDTAW